MSSIKLRKVNADDIYLLFNWANEQLVRENSFSKSPICWEDHNKWFHDKVTSKDCKMFILEVNNNDVGQVRFDNVNNQYWLIDYSIDNKFRRNGYGLKIVKYGIRTFDVPVKFIAKVKNNNIASIKVFNRLKFSTTPNDTKNVVFTLSLES